MDHPLKQFRLRRELSQEELAKIIGTTKVAVSRYENGKRTPSAAMMKRINSVTNGQVTPNDFVLVEWEDARC